MTYGRAAGGLLAIVLAIPACFDSDQTFKVAATTTGTSGTSTTTTDATTTTTETTSPSETGPQGTCRDAIDCIFQCAAIIQAQIQMDPGFEPDLGCFLECANTLSADEVYILFNLINCTSEVCKELGECVPASSESSGSGSSSEGSSSSSSGSSSSSEGGGSIIDPCIDCIFTRLLDTESPGCEEFAMMCQ